MKKSIIILILMIFLVGCKNNIENYNLEIKIKTGGYTYKEFVTEIKIDNKILEKNDFLLLQLEERIHKLSWEYANKDKNNEFVNKKTNEIYFELDDYTKIEIYGSALFNKSTIILN